MATNLAAQSISPLIGLGGRIIVGIDPGAANLGLCAVEVTSGSALYMAGDVIDGSLSPSKIADEVLHFVEITHPDRIAIEDMTTRYVRPQVAMALLLTARIAGYVAGYLHARGHAVDQVSVYDWKRRSVAWRPRPINKSPTRSCRSSTCRPSRSAGAITCAMRAGSPYLRGEYDCPPCRPPVLDLSSPRTRGDRCSTARHTVA